MRRVLRLVAVAALALAFTGGSSVAAAIMATAPAQAHSCRQQAHHCNEALFTRCCCADDDHGAPAPLPVSPNLTSVVKSQSKAAACEAISTFAMTITDARETVASPARRAGPPIALSILHASLLL